MTKKERIAAIIGKIEGFKQTMTTAFVGLEVSKVGLPLQNSQVIAVFILDHFGPRLYSGRMMLPGTAGGVAGRGGHARTTISEIRQQEDRQTDSKEVQQASPALDCDCCL